MPFRRYRRKAARGAKSVARPVRRGLRARYVPKNKRGKRTANIGRIVRDLAFVKRQLNTEWKSTDPIATTVGFDTPAIPFIPTKSAPVCFPLSYPATIGTSGLGDRVGKKVKIVNLHLRWRLQYENNAPPNNTGNPTGPVHYKIYIVWEKRQDTHATVPADHALRIFKADPIGNKSYISQFDELEYKDFLITYKSKGIMRPLAQPAVDYYRNTRYMEHNIPLSIHQEFDDSNNLTMNRPWLLILTDNDNQTNEHIKFSLIHKTSYVDN